MLRNKFIYFACGALMLGFTTACDDDDTVIDESVITPIEKPDLVIDVETMRVKIGEPAQIPVTSGGGDYSAFSLSPEIVDVTIIDGVAMIEGKKNGTGEIIISDAAGNYKSLTVSVYTTDELTLSQTDVKLVTPLGFSSMVKESVLLGNGGYRAVSDNRAVSVSIGEESGEISISATSTKTDINAVITVSDVTGLTATMNVTVKYTLDAFTESDLAAFCELTESAAELNGNVPAYFNYYPDNFSTQTADGKDTFGWVYNSWTGAKYCWLEFEYPANAAIGQTVSGKASLGSYGSVTYQGEGSVKVVKNDDTSKVVVFWNVDEAAERINRGYLVEVK